jgi:Tropinone reductase 1
VDELAGFGVRVHTCACGDPDLQECLHQWGADGRLARVTGTACDVTVHADRERLVAAAREELGGRLDILVNNAGQTMFQLTTETTAEDYARLMATNLESCYHLAQLAHPLLVAAAATPAASSTSPPSAGLSPTWQCPCTRRPRPP